MNVFEQIKVAKEATQKIGDALELIAKLKVADADKDGRPDLVEIVERGTALVGKVGRVREQIEDMTEDFNEITKLAGANFELVIEALDLQEKQAKKA